MSKRFAFDCGFVFYKGDEARFIASTDREDDEYPYETFPIEYMGKTDHYLELPSEEFDKLMDTRYCMSESEIYACVVARKEAQISHWKHIASLILGELADKIGEAEGLYDILSDKGLTDNEIDEISGNFDTEDFDDDED